MTTEEYLDELKKSIEAMSEEEFKEKWNKILVNYTDNSITVKDILDE